MPEISVIVPFYNAQQYLNKSIHSVLNQSFQDFELILVNDGSVDYSLLYCNALAQKDSRIRILDLPHVGVTAARTAGIKAAKGKYICFVDSDDFVDSGYLVHLYHAIVESGTDFSMCRLWHHLNDSSEIIDIPIKNGVYKGEALENIRMSHAICTNGMTISLISYLCGKLFKRELLVNNLQYMNPLTLSEDTVLTTACLLDANSICVIDDVDYHYVRHSGTITTSFHKNLYEEIKAFRKEMYAITKDKGYASLKPKVDACIINIIYLSYATEERKRPADIPTELADLIRTQNCDCGDKTYRKYLSHLKALYAPGSF